MTHLRNAARAHAVTTMHENWTAVVLPFIFRWLCGERLVAQRAGQVEVCFSRSAGGSGTCHKPESPLRRMHGEL